MILVSSNIALLPTILDEKYDLADLSEDFCFFSEVGKRFYGSRTGKGVNLSAKNEMITWGDEIHELREIDLKAMMNQFNVKFYT